MLFMLVNEQIQQMQLFILSNTEITYGLEYPRELFKDSSFQQTYTCSKSTIETLGKGVK